jgi:cell fate regulator YaaT (PSP1 superfamily)
MLSGEKLMPRVVSVRFRRAGRSYRFSAGQLDLRPGDSVVARTARGLELGIVSSGPTEFPGDRPREDLKPVVRKATPDDLRRDEENAAREREAMEVAARKIAEHDLKMKLIEAEATLDGSRMVLHFSAEGRVDFRALVRDLAKALRTRVELHQVGVRDEAKMRGGLGHCGRALCCASFLTDFDPVGIKMAKEQELSLNPQKISGVCGRLMCCLAFEPMPPEDRQSSRNRPRSRPHRRHRRGSGQGDRGAGRRRQSGADGGRCCPPQAGLPAHGGMHSGRGGRSRCRA